MDPHRNSFLDTFPSPTTVYPQHTLHTLHVDEDVLGLDIAMDHHLLVSFSASRGSAKSITRGLV